MPRFSFCSIILYSTPTTKLPATIDSAAFSVYASSKSDDLGVSPTYNVFTSAPASDTSIAAGDFDSLGSTALATMILLLQIFLPQDTTNGYFCMFCSPITTS